MAASRKLTTAREKPRGLYHDLGLRLVKLLNVLMVVLPFVCCWLLYYAQRVVVFPSPWRSVCVVGLFILLYAGFGRVYDAFLVSIKRISELFWGQLLGILMADAFMFIVLWLMSGGFPNLFPALLALVGQLLLSLFWCKCANSWYFRRFSGQKTAIIYDHERGIADLFSQYGLNKKFDVRLICTVDECLRSGMDVLGNSRFNRERECDKIER